MGSMLMVEKRTDRVQIQNYANRGVDIFDQIESSLQSLVEQTANVNYRGPNALLFKTQCTTNAIDFAQATSQTMEHMSNAIQNATNFIATTLGGNPITLEPPSLGVAMPVISADESVEAADDTALLQLRDQVNVLYSEIVACFEENLGNLERLGVDGWWGPEYDDALTNVQRLTTLAVDRCDQSRNNMATTIQTQVDLLFGG